MTLMNVASEEQLEQFFGSIATREARFSAARVIGADGSVTGLDLNAGMLNIARAHDLQGTVQWREGSAQAMP